MELHSFCAIQVSLKLILGREGERERENGTSVEQYYVYFHVKHPKLP